MSTPPADAVPPAVPGDEPADEPGGGTAQVPPPPPSGGAAGACPLCGGPVGAGADRCPDCGMTLAGVAGRSGPFSRRDLWLWAAALLVLYLIVLGIVALAG